LRITIETNFGQFAAYLNTSGEIVIYEGDNTCSVAVIEPLIKRQSVLDLSTDGITKAVRTWLENNHSRLEIECVTVRLVPPGR
jgi:hypothetical protein